MLVFGTRQYIDPGIRVEVLVEARPSCELGAEELRVTEVQGAAEMEDFQAGDLASLETCEGDFSKVLRLFVRKVVVWLTRFRFWFILCFHTFVPIYDNIFSRKLFFFAFWNVL